MKHNRSAKDYLLLVLRGMAMGAVDVIPGVSGGTMALITGIYEELINSIKSFNAGLIATLRKQGITKAWERINGYFLAAVLSGILISIFSLVRLLSWLFDNHAMMIWAFFFGLILGSVFYVGSRIKNRNALSWLFLIAGSAVAYYVTIATPATGPDHLWFIFLAGSIAFCAMILPGISGAFILVLLGKYEYMINAVKDWNMMVIVVFGIGGIGGIIAFSNAIGWLLKKYPNATLAMLTGFMIGSLNKLWPWKEVLETRIGTSGEEIPVLERSILPSQYAALYGESPQVLPVMICALAGLALILAVMFFAGKLNKE
ncbi:MAG: DUF368 domain-containing protein [Bacteroidia bacterium]|nr:MAG: DUF368 domain-containing protein [Bacteroidia bacterium]